MPWGGRATTAVLDEQVVKIAHHTLRSHQLACEVGHRAVVTESTEGFDAVAHIKVEEEAGAVIAADRGGHRGRRAPGLLAAGENRRKVARFDHPPETDDPVGLECADGVPADDARRCVERRPGRGRVRRCRDVERHRLTLVDRAWLVKLSVALTVTTAESSANRTRGRADPVAAGP